MSTVVGWLSKLDVHNAAGPDGLSDSSIDLRISGCSAYKLVETKINDLGRLSFNTLVNW